MIMYIDTVVASGIAIMVLTCVMVTYVAIFAYKHIKQDSEKFDKQQQDKKLKP